MFVVGSAAAKKQDEKVRGAGGGIKSDEEKGILMIRK